MKRLKDLKVACLQYCPSWKNLTESRKIIENLLIDVEPGSIDIIVLPEMALSGYVLTLEEVKVYAEKEQETIDWCIDLSKFITDDS